MDSLYTLQATEQKLVRFKWNQLISIQQDGTTNICLISLLNNWCSSYDSFSFINRWTLLLLYGVWLQLQIIHASSCELIFVQYLESQHVWKCSVSFPFLDKYFQLIASHFCRLQGQNMKTLTCLERTSTSMMRRESAQSWYPTSVPNLKWWSKMVVFPHARPR